MDGAFVAVESLREHHNTCQLTCIMRDSFFFLSFSPFIHFAIPIRLNRSVGIYFAIKIRVVNVADDLLLSIRKGIEAIYLIERILGKDVINLDNGM